MNIKNIKVMENSKTIFVLTFLFTILLAVASCTKPDNPPAPTPAAPVLKVTAPTGTLAYGDSTSFSWTTTGKVTSVTLDSKAVSPSGSHNTGRLLADQSYDLKAIGPGGVDSKTVAIKVGDWTTSNYGIVSHNYWIFDSLGFKDDSMKNFYMYTYKEINPIMFDISYYYFPTGKYEEKSIKSGKITFEDHWELLPNDTIVIAGVEKMGIKTITKTKMVLVEHAFESYDSNGDGVLDSQRPILIKTVYKRDK